MQKPDNRTQSSLRIDTALQDDLAAIAKAEKRSINQVKTDALKFYRDYYYLQNKASLLNEQVVEIIQNSLRMLERRINHRTNALLSELAIQSAIQNLMIAENLEVDPANLQKYRVQAVDALRQQNRVFRLEEVLKIETDTEHYL